MAIAIVNNFYSWSQWTIDNTVTVTATAGRFLLAFHSVGGTVTGWSTGWEKWSSASTSRAFYYRVATGDANDNLTINHAGVQYSRLFVKELTDVDLLDPIDFVHEINTSRWTLSSGMSGQQPFFGDATSAGRAVAFMGIAGASQLAGQYTPSIGSNESQGTTNLFGALLPSHIAGDSLSFSWIQNPEISENTTYAHHGFLIALNEAGAANSEFEVAVDETKVVSPQTDFRLLISLADMPASFWSSVSAGGGDIRIYGADGLTELPREVVSCNTAGQTGEVWTLVPTLSDTVSTVLTVLTKAGRLDYAVDHTKGRNAVWSDYGFVFHGETLVDSTGKSGTVTSAFVSVAATERTAGIIGKDYLYGSGGLNNTVKTSLAPAGINATDTFTMSIWFEPAIPATLPYLSYFFGVAYNSDAYANFSLYMSRSGANLGFGVFDRTTTASADTVLTLTSYTGRSLITVEVTASGSTVSVFNEGTRTDGVASNRHLQGSGFDVISVGSVQDLSPLWGDESYLDESRIYLGARSTDREQTEYDNQRSPSTFYATSVAGSPVPVSFTGNILTLNATVGVPFSVNLSANWAGNRTPFTYAMSSGTLPLWASLDAATAVLSGTPDAVALTSGLAVTATDLDAVPAPSNAFSIDVVAPADTTPPALTSPTGVKTGSTTATGGADTNEANGTIHAIVDGSAANPTPADITAHTTAEYWNNLPVSSIGAKTFNATGLTAGATRYWHFVHYDAAGNPSNVVTSPAFILDAATAAAIAVTDTGKLLATSFIEDSTALKPSISDTGVVTAKEFIEDSAGGFSYGDSDTKANEFIEGAL